MQGFGTGIYEFVSHVRNFGPGRDQSPFHCRQIQLIGWMGDDCGILTRGDIKAGEVLKIDTDRFEMRFNRFDGFGKGKSAAHFLAVLI